MMKHQKPQDLYKFFVLQKYDRQLGQKYEKNLHDMRFRARKSCEKIAQSSNRTVALF